MTRAPVMLQADEAMLLRNELDDMALRVTTPREAATIGCLREMLATATERTTAPAGAKLLMVWFDAIPIDGRESLWPQLPKGSSIGPGNADDGFPVFVPEGA